VSPAYTEHRSPVSADASSGAAVQGETLEFRTCVSIMALPATDLAAATGCGTASSVPRLLRLGPDHVPGPVGHVSADAARLRSSVYVSGALWAAWCAQCARMARDPGAALAPVWALLLHRYTGLDDLVLGLLDARRSSAPAGRSTAPAPATALRVTSALDGDALWSAWVADWPTRLAAAHSAAAAASPVQLAMVITDGDAVAAGELSLTPGADTLDAVLRVAIGLGGVRLVVDCSAQAIGPAALARLRRNFVTLLHACMTRPESRVGALPLVSRTEWRRMDRWNHTAVALPPAAGGEGIHRLVEQQVDRTPDAVAVVQDGEVLGFAELDRRANVWAHRLMALGVQPHAMVGVYLERSFEMVVAMLAIWKTGGAYLPLEPDFPAQRLHDTIADSAAQIVLTTGPLRTGLPASVTAVCMDEGVETTLSALPGHRLPSRTQGADACYVIYTSGSTGKPKGAVLPHRAICNHMAWMVAHYQLGADDHVLQKTPFSFDASVWEFLAPLLTGARLVLARPGGHRDMPYLARTIAEHRVTTLQLVPSVLQLLVDEPAFVACTSLRRVFCGGEALTTALARRFAVKLPAELHNLYGPTECCIDTTTFACRADLTADVQPIGRPIWNTTHHVLDRFMQPVPLGVPGELYIGGAGLALGYLHRAALTAEKFVANPFDTDGSQPRLYRTGDRVRLLPDGNFEFLGRIDFQVKLHGFRIELGEIEAVLETHPLVRQAVALLREDLPGHKLLVAYVVPAGACEPTSTELREYMARALPSYMLPSVCVVLASLPLTSNGKVDRRALPRPERVVARSGSAMAANAVADKATATETKLAQVWARQLAAHDVGLEDDFFAVGGDSLGLMQIALAIRAELGVDVESEQLFAHRTVRAQAGLVDAVQRAVATPIDVHGGTVSTALATLPPQVTSGLASVEQQVFWSGARAYRGWPLFNTSEVIGFTRPPNLPALQQAVDAVVAHHECLRTVLQQRDSALWQSVMPAGPVTLERVAQQPDGSQGLHDIVAGLVQRPFQLEQGPAARWVLVSTDGATAWLVMIVHHAMTDGHSMQLIVHHLLAAYSARLRGVEPDEPARGPRYLAYAAWQRSRMHAGVFDAAKRHWQHVLANGSSPLRLPACRRRRAIERWHGGRETRVLDAEFRHALKAMAASRNISLYMALLTGYALLLWEQTGQTDIVVGSSTAGRSTEALQGLAGCTIGAIPLRVQVDPGDTLARLLDEVRRICLDAYAHQDLPLGLTLQAAPVHAGPTAKLPLPVWLELHDRQRAWETQFPDLGIERHDVDRGISESELSLEIDDTGTALVCHAQYKSDLFAAERVRSWLERYQQWLEMLATATDSRLPIRAISASCRVH
jgi:amino acid adenylation domain-containing protein